MNVQCPNCATTFRVDPAKVPERGVRARCSVCAAVFPVKRAEGAHKAGRPEPASQPSVSAAPAVAARPTPAPAPPSPPPPQLGTQAAAPLMPPAIPGARPPQPRAGMTTPIPAPAVTAPRPVAGGRPMNPFLSQDPGQKARRLARALVSDMVVYHPAKRRDALKAGTIKESFKEEITKSWEEYVEQVGRDLAESTPYFREALNEILGDGQPVF